MAKKIAKLTKNNNELEAEIIDLSNREVEILLAYIRVRDSYLQLQWLENNGIDDTSAVRNSLYENYCDFYQLYGRMGKSRNRNLIIETDPWGFLIASSVEFKQGLEYLPATVLTTDPRDIVEFLKTENVHDALSYCLGIHGRVDIDIISNITDKEPDEVLRELDQLIYYDPLDSCWITADKWLSGNVYSKMVKTKELLEQLQQEL